MARKICKFLFIATGAVLALLTVFLAITLAGVLRLASASVGIIGGADGPTAVFLLNNVVNTPLFYIWCTVLVVFIGSGIVLRSTRMKERK